MSAPDPYDLGARAVAATTYRGRRDIAGDRYDRAVDGPLIDFGDNSSWVDPEQPTLLDGGES